MPLNLQNLFLTKIYNILQVKLSKQDQENQHLIFWIHEGTAFNIVNIFDFCQKILHKHFRHSNYNSFVRQVLTFDQLNIYNFSKIFTLGYQNVFYNQHFIRGKQDLIYKIKRKVKDKEESYKNNLQQLFTFQAISYLQVQQIKKKQDSFDIYCETLIQQNTAIIKQNKLLWSRIHQNIQNRDGIIQMLLSLLFRKQIYSKKLQCKLSIIDGQYNLQDQNDQFLKKFTNGIVVNSDMIKQIANITANKNLYQNIKKMIGVQTRKRLKFDEPQIIEKVQLTQANKILKDLQILQQS